MEVEQYIGDKTYENMAYTLHNYFHLSFVKYFYPTTVSEQLDLTFHQYFISVLLNLYFRGKKCDKPWTLKNKHTI